MIGTRKHPDGILMTVMIIIALLGVFFVYSATYNHDSGWMPSPFAVKQAMWAGVGIGVMYLIMRADYLKLLNFAYAAYAINLMVLVALLFMGHVRYGARRWIDFGPISVQPSEFIKLTFILALAAFLGDRRDSKGSFSNFIGAILLMAPAAILIFIQPDLGTAFVLIPILFAVLFVCGEKLTYIVATIAGGLLSLPILWSLLKGYQRDRLLVFLNPNIDPLGAGYTIIQSKIAIGSGGFFGKGWLNGTQTYLKFLPEKHTDFIFSVIGEEWGFVGALVLVGLYATVIARGAKIMAGMDEPRGKVIATGVVTLLTIQVFTNIAMTIGIMPVVGIPLPAISYGGSNALMFLMSMGFLLSVGRKADM